MIAYLDASALVKRYVAERGSTEVATLLREADAVGTVLITLAEVGAALAKAARLGVLDAKDAETAVARLREEWPDLIRLPITEPLLHRAVDLAWEFGLRGYDAVQLAAAQAWQEVMEETVMLVTFDRHLWDAAPRAGLKAYPTNPPDLRTPKEPP
jgi:predicted nucleic acid-binding protein